MSTNNQIEKLEGMVIELNHTISKNQIKLSKNLLKRGKTLYPRIYKDTLKATIIRSLLTELPRENFSQSLKDFREVIYPTLGPGMKSRSKDMGTLAELQDKWMMEVYLEICNMIEEITKED